MNSETAKNGFIEVRVNSKVNYGGLATPIEIRDDNLNLVASSSSKRLFELPVGLYEISAILEDGKRQKHVIKITESDKTIVALTPQLSYQPSAPETLFKFLSVKNIQASAKDARDVELVTASQNVTIYPENGFWIVRHYEEMDQVAYAIIKKGERTIDASLPISAGDHRLSVTCHIKTSPKHTEQPVKVNISQTRSLSAALESMFIAGQFDSATKLASQALSTLMNNFVDPTGATLAALILQKAGKLKHYQVTLEKLANDFPWLPDGKILLASIMMTKPEQRHLAIELAHRASQQRILFTESFSILMSLLRYAPESDNTALCDEALTHIAKIATSVDWNSIYLCRVSTDESDA
ncbi:hypothetical protein [Pseudomonas taetrolens]|uniref:hypothetical protein n=1 Tax=Pseudomonas taetrolens TaxID=47884 RepID=UPI003F94C7EF